MRRDADLVLRALANVTAGPIASVLPRPDGEGLGRGESARGPVWHWLEVRDGRIAQSFAADPAMRLWPELERVTPGRAVAQLLPQAARMGLATAGVDL